MIFCNPDFIDSRKFYHLLTGVLGLDASDPLAPLGDRGSSLYKSLPTARIPA